MKVQQRNSNMPIGDKIILKQVLRDECLPALARQAAYFSVADVRDWLRLRNLTCPPALLREYLSAFMRGGVIHDAGRGWYSRIAEPCAINEKPVARLSKEVAKAFPLLDFTCWSTEQLRSYGHPARRRHPSLKRLPLRSGLILARRQRTRPPTRPMRRGIGDVTGTPPAITSEAYEQLHHLASGAVASEAKMKQGNK